MARKRLFSVLAALALLLSGFSFGVSAQAGSSGTGPSQWSETTSLDTHAPPNKCRRWKRRARNGNRRARRKYRRHCKGTGAGGGGGGTGGAGTCEAYKPGAEGAEAETSIVTDENTEEAPLEVTVPVGEGIPESPNNTPAYHNVQVNSSADHTGLWVRFEFAEPEDMDLYLLFADSSEAAHAAGYNPAPVVPGQTDGTGNGGHSEVGAEVLDGIGTDDCGGYTVDMRPFQNAPGDKTLKLWLGEVGCEPPCGEP